MHITAPIEESHLRVIAATVMVLSDVHRHMQIFDAVSQKPECETPIFEGLSFVVHDQLEFIDFVHDAAVLWVISAELGIVSRLIEGTSTGSQTPTDRGRKTIAV
jgi:hypothetical protein